MDRALSKLKTKDLKRLAFLTGTPSATTKAELQHGLLASLSTPKLRDGRSKLLSIDMGIRNLAYSVLHVKPSGASKLAGAAAAIGSIEISHWHKLDLLTQIREAKLPSLLDKTGLQQPDEEGKPEQLSTAGLFTPPVISEIALTLTERVLAHQPDVILIERQRFRSGGGSAIQEWTIRVNMLESMLWACFAAMRRQCTTSDAFPAIHSVEPARVAKFWHQMQDMPSGITLSSDTDVDTVKSAARAKVTKAQRMTLLRKWMQRSNDGLLPMTFTGQAEQTVVAFNNTRSKGKAAGHPGKLDDLTDCLMQGAAWVRWEVNRRAIAHLLRDAES